MIKTCTDMLMWICVALTLFTIIVIAITPICDRLDIITKKLENIENTISAEEERVVE